MTQQPYGEDPPSLRKSLGVVDGVAIAASSTAAHGPASASVWA